MFKSKTVYNVDQLNNLLNQKKYVDESTKDFFENFNENIILRINSERENTQNVLMDEFNENDIKRKITQLLNRMSPSDINKTYNEIKKITITSEEEILTLINSLIYKIKTDTDNMKPCVAELCKKLCADYFKSDKEDIKFHQLFLKKIYEEYKKAMNYNNYDYETQKDKAKEVIVLLGTLINSKVIETSLIKSIANDFEKRVKFNGDEDNEKFKYIEISINLLHVLVTCISNDTICEFEKIKETLREGIEKFNEIKKSNQSKTIKISDKPRTRLIYGLTFEQIESKIKDLVPKENI